MWKFLRLNEGSVCMCVCMCVCVCVILIIWSECLVRVEATSEARPEATAGHCPLNKCQPARLFSLLTVKKWVLHTRNVSLHSVRTEGSECEDLVLQLWTWWEELIPHLTSCTVASGCRLVTGLQSAVCDAVPVQAEMICLMVRHWFADRRAPTDQLSIGLASAGTGEWAGQYWHYWSDCTASSTVTNTDHPPMIGRRLGEIRPATDHNQWYSLLSHNYLPSSHWELPSGYFATQCPPFFSLSFQHLDLIQTRGESVFMRTRNTFAKKVHLGIWIFMVVGSSLKHHL